MNISQRATDLAESATLAVASKAAKMKADGIDVVGFGAGEPDFGTPDHIKKACIAAVNEGHTGYTKPASGLAAAKEAVCTKFLRDNELKYDPSQVIITAGGKMAVYLAVQALVNPGDEVIIPKPYWVSYPEIVKLAGGIPVFIAGPEQNDYRISPAELDAAITDRTRMVFLNSPSNPSGACYSPDEYRALGEVMQDKNLVVLSDEIYDRLVFDGQQIISYAATSEAAYAQTLTANAASKTYAMTGWRLGYVGGPTEIIRTMAKLQSQMTSGAVHFNQHALVEALTGDQSSVETMRTEFASRRDIMHSRLNAMPGVTCLKPTGAFYCFPNVAGTFAKLGVDGSADFAARLLKQANVAVVPGVAFGLDQHVRLSFATSVDQIEKGLSRLGKILG